MRTELYNNHARELQKLTVLQTWEICEKWGVSRARDSEGYNIVTMRDQQGRKARATGGGYDMVGTAVAEYICATPELQARLEKYYRTRASLYYNAKTKKWGKVERPEQVYGLTYYRGEHRARIDGATGIDNVRRVCAAAGIIVEFVGYNKSPRNWVRTGFKIYLVKPLVKRKAKV